MSKLLEWISFIIIFILVVGYFTERNGEKTSSSDTVDVLSSANTQEITPQKEIFSTTARTLFKNYEDNEVATDEKMKGKLVSVKGVVQSIDKDFTDSIVIHFRTENEFMPARMEMRDSEKSAVINLKKGQQITVICEDMARLAGSPSGSNCVFAQ